MTGFKRKMTVVRSQPMQLVTVCLEVSDDDLAFTLGRLITAITKSCKGLRYEKVRDEAVILLYVPVGHAEEVEGVLSRFAADNTFSFERSESPGI